MMATASLLYSSLRQSFGTRAMDKSRARMVGTG
jgi:hypothetical protein